MLSILIVLPNGFELSGPAHASSCYLKITFQCPTQANHVARGIGCSELIAGVESSSRRHADR
jgi:hypothetical protein